MVLRYELGQEELSRRLYGPETLNLRNIVDILSNQRTNSKPSEVTVRAHLLKHGLEIPKCPPVVSSFTRLCEG